jgi:hypothetical protein
MMSPRCPMSSVHEGGCLCRDIRYETRADPIWMLVCHCTFCQRLTGSAFLVEPIFRRDAVVFSGGAPRTYDHRSDGSGMRVSVNFCGNCGTTLYLGPQRFPETSSACAVRRSTTPTGSTEDRRSVATSSRGRRRRASRFPRGFPRSRSTLSSSTGRRTPRSSTRNIGWCRARTSPRARAGTARDAESAVTVRAPFVPAPRTISARTS